MSADKVFALVASIAVALVVVAGLYLGGAPSEQRLFRYDERRVNDLRSLSGSISRRWNNTGSLPGSLDELVDGQMMRRVPLDPETGASYVYEITSDNVYSLCAVFARPTLNPVPDDFWIHHAGYQCFEVTLAKAE